MKKTFLLIIVSLSAFLLLQCQYAKEAVKDLNDLAKKEKSKEKTDEDEGSKDVSSSSSETEGTLKRRKETK